MKNSIFSFKKNIIVIVIAALLALGVGGAAVAIGVSSMPANRVSRYMGAAERYLSEMNYEQAVIEFQKIIEIETMNVEAYLGLADAYLGLGNKDAAIKVLQNGYERTGDERIKAKLDGLINAQNLPVSGTTSTDKPVESTLNTASEPVYGSMGSVTILGTEYDVATTTKLYFGHEGITSDVLKEIMPQIKQLTNLTELGLQGNQITDITPLAVLTNLVILNLCWNQINDIEPLKGLTNLTDLDLFDNQITDITPLSGLTNLTRLHLSFNKIIDITPLARLTNLTALQINDNQITDITPLSGLTNLTRLHLSFNKIIDITTLAGLINLTELDLGTNQISDISSLKGLTNLTRLNLWRNQITNADIDRLKSQLPNCDINF